MKLTPIAQAVQALILQGRKVAPTHSVHSGGECACSAGPACKSPGKHPIGRLAPRGYHDATDDPQVIERWFEQAPDAGIALAAGKSGLVVLDFDVRNGGAETLADLRAAHPSFAAALDKTVQVRSQGGGWHFYFRAAPDVRYPSAIGRGADVKHHGLVMLPPSRGPLGQYMWVEGHSLFDREPLPAAAIECVLRPKPIALARERRGEEQPNAVERNDLAAALRLLDSNDRDVWIKVGYALWTAGAAGERLWFEWSRRSPKYDERDAAATWRSFDNSESHWRAVFTYAQEAADAWVARLNKRRAGR